MNIIKVVVILVVIYIVYRIVRMMGRAKVDKVKGYRVDDKPSSGEDLVQDPFCRTYVPKSQAYLREIDGREQFFYSRECCEKYLSANK
jgi:YHS domain-containing protein